jgi:hypothetical protein
LEENWMVICHLISKKFSIVVPFKQLTREVACSCTELYFTSYN